MQRSITYSTETLGVILLIWAKYTDHFFTGTAKKKVHPGFFMWMISYYENV